MKSSVSHTFEVLATADGQYAVLIDGVRIALHALELDAQEHSVRLKLQAAEQPEAWGR
jgi:hypothetical protein